MPIYEYVCEQDGTRIELLRPMSEADAPVDDPQNKGRLFTRAVTAPNAKTSGGGGAGVSLGACCPCGKNAGGCGGGRA
jgi:putative FmdB family regulatory protein